MRHALPNQLLRPRLVELAESLGALPHARLNIDRGRDNRPAEEVARLRIAARAEHADQAFGGRVGRLAELFEADRRLDGVAQDRLAGLDVAGQHRVDPLAQKVFRERGVARHAALHQFLEALRQGHVRFVNLR